MKETNLVIGIYYHPEAYPPTLNAVKELSGIFTTISLIHRPHLKGNWQYPGNVTAIPSGKFITASGQQSSSAARKIFFLKTFVYDLWKSCRKNKPGVILLYDAHALYAYSLIRPFLFFPHKLWYHSHDVSEIERERKYSIGWFACRTEKSIFKRIDLFTLPTAERLSFFPVSELKGQYFIIPNYPSKSFYSPFYHPKKLQQEIKLIFQGRIGEGHGLEEIIPLLAGTLSGRLLRLVLKGHCDAAYKEQLLMIAAKYNVTDRLSFAGFTAYKEVPATASLCDIGIAIFAKKDLMNNTLGTASNKIYEYAALGLPVICLENSPVADSLAGYEWVIPVALNSTGIKKGLEKITGDYEKYSGKAHDAFMEKLNFEIHFRNVTKYIEKYFLTTRGEYTMKETAENV